MVSFITLQIRLLCWKIIHITYNQKYSNCISLNINYKYFK
jgi:hypothetical protein